jgi:hypothetical protein
MRFSKIRDLLKSSFSGNLLILCGSQEGDPLSPPEGEAAQGEHPLAPSFVGVFHQPSDDYRKILGDARAAGAEARCTGTPKSDYLFLSRISTKPRFAKIHGIVHRKRKNAFLKGLLYGITSCALLTMQEQYLRK